MKKISIILSSLLIIGTVNASEIKKEESGLKNATFMEKTEKGELKQVNNPLYRGN